MDNNEVHKYTSEINESEDSDYMVIVWHKDDVHSRAMELTDSKVSPLTDQQAREILKETHRTHDCTIGITWESFDIGIYRTFKFAIKTLDLSEYLIDDNKKVLLFPNIGSAEDFLYLNAISFGSVSIDVYIEEEGE